MADIFRLNGNYSTCPAGSPDGQPSLDAPIDELMTLIRKQLSDYELTGDAPVDVDFGGLANAHVVIVKSVGGKVRVRLTSADGSQQAISVDSFAVIMSQSVPYTAIDLTRPPAVGITVTVFLGERA